ncbi:MAG: YvcK family protein [Micrococcaceae bacterium]
MSSEFLPTGPLPVTFSSMNDQKKVVALGGGHGLYTSLKALKLLTEDLTALVTVADDGGSSGRIRQQLPHMLPPGDLRMALSALCDDTSWGKTWREVMQYRFTTNGDLNGHSVGNMLLVALWDLTGDQVESLETAAKLLEAKGTVLPMSLEPLDIEGDLLLDGEVVTISGQHNLAKAKGKILDVRLSPPEAKIPHKAEDALMNADYIVVGPGSLYTSILPHFLLENLRTVLGKTDAKLCFALNINLSDDETDGMKAVDHLKVLENFAHGIKFDYIIVNSESLDDKSAFERQAQKMGAEVISEKLAHSHHPEVHDPLRLATVYNEIFNKD